ncbi:unnamed protein product [Ixodes hexagonus]
MFHQCRAACVVPLLLCLQEMSVVAARKPNFIIMIMDDMGWGDLGVLGHPAKETPNIDRMAAEGMLFTDFYTASPLCSPSRAALLTGRLPIRNGFYTTNNHSRNAYTPQEIVGGIQDEEVLIPELLAIAGYRNAIIGKWHLGHREQYLPLNHGFHEWFGSPNCHFGPYDNVERPNVAFFRDSCMIGRYFEDFEIDLETRTSNLTLQFTQEAVEFIDRQHDRPFFLYWAPDSSHAPVYSSRATRGRSIRGAYGDAVQELDQSVGAILGALRRWGIDNNTFVFWTSDNGAALVSKTEGTVLTNGPFLCGKQTTFEGGFREPAIAWWPGVIEAGQMTRQPLTVLDLLPTIAELAQVTLPPGLVLDGNSFVPELLKSPHYHDEEEISDRSVFYYRGNELMALRKGLYKAHFWCWTNSWEQYRTGIDFCPGFQVPGVTTHVQSNYTSEPILFHLGRDPGEKFPIRAGTKEYNDSIAPILRAYHEHKSTMVPGKPQLNWCDDSVMHWAPPCCGRLQRCLQVPPSRPYLCDWPH